MNIVGKLGQFFIDYQNAIEALLVILLLVIIAIWAFSYFKKKRAGGDSLEAINAKISEIENKVNQMGAAGDAVATADAPDVASTKELAEEPVAVAITEPEELNGEEELTQEVVAEESPEEPEEDQDNELDEEAEGEVEIDIDFEPGEEIDITALTEALAALDEILMDDEEQEPIVAPKKTTKFTSRDWNEDRFGNVYTEDMLKDRIG